MKRFEVTYYVNRMPRTYGFDFQSVLGAVNMARTIFEHCELATDVMDCKTGEIIAIFEPNNVYISDEYMKGAIMEMR